MPASPISHLQTWSQNLQRNLGSSLSELSVRDGLRLLIILGGYALLRPYLLKLGGRIQARGHEDEGGDGAVRAGADDHHEADGEGDGDWDGEGERERGAADWGRGARARQRRAIRRILEAEEEMRRAEADEAESDREIEDLLIED